MPTVVRRRTPLCDRRYARTVKPVLDRVLAIVLGLLLLPIAAAIALGVRACLGSPVLYRQTRVGLGGKEFRIVKFRSMTEDRRTGVEPPPGPERRLSYEACDDTRHTPFGDWLRRWSLDELPQLWNVLAGDMSLVGPRPEVPAVVASYETWQRERHRVRPGITGLWQVTARAAKPMHANVALDVDYVRRVGFALDCRIALRTFPAALAADRDQAGTAAGTRRP